MSWKDKMKRAGKLLVTGGADEMVGEMREHKRLVAEGQTSAARCDSLKLNWELDRDAPRWGSTTMTLTVTPLGGGEPYSWSGDVWMRVSQARQLDPGLALVGRELVVRIDPDDPQKLTVDWEAVAAQTA